MKTQPTQGVAIEPIVYPLNAGTATQMSVLILNFTTEATTCTTKMQKGERSFNLRPPNWKKSRPISRTAYE